MPRGKRARASSIETPDRSKKQPVLTLSHLASYDDVLTDALVDRVYFWSTIRKNRARFAASRGIHEEDITNIVRKHVIVGKDALKATNEILQLPGMRKYVERLEDEDKREHFRRHLRKYVNIYLPDCPFEVSTTNRYTIDTQEASVTARTEIRRGEVIKYLCGIQVAITKAEEKQLDLTRGDFSIVMSSRKKTPSMFLGPARFANHDCDANARLSTTGANGMQIVASKDIEIGDEITVTYGTDYFGEDNCECLCGTCERLERNGWGPQVESEDDDEEDEDSPKQEEVKNSDDEDEDEEDESMEDIQVKTPYSFRRPRKYGSEAELTPVEEPPTRGRRRSMRGKRKNPPKSETKAPPAKRKKVVEDRPERNRSITPMRSNRRSGRSTAAARRVNESPPRENRRRGRSTAAARRVSVSPPRERIVTARGRPVTRPVWKSEREQQRPISDIPAATGNRDESRGRTRTRGRPRRARVEESDSSRPRSDAVSAVFSEKSASSTPVSTPDSDIRRTARAWKPSRRLKEAGVATSIEINVKANITIGLTVHRVDSPESALTSLSQIDADEASKTASRRKQPKPSRKSYFSRELQGLLGDKRDIKAQPSPSPAAMIALSTTETTVSSVRRPGDYTLTTALLCSKYSRWVNCNTCDADFVQEDAYLTRKECPRCERHSKLYGYGWPKTDKEGRFDSEERVLDHRTIHRFIEPKEEKVQKRGRKAWQLEVAKRVESEESERVAEERAGGRRLRARSRSVVGVRTSYREEEWA